MYLQACSSFPEVRTSNCELCCVLTHGHSTLHLPLLSPSPPQAHTLPRLPPLTSSRSEKKDFSFPTPADIKHSHRLQDAVVVEHSPSNPACRCAMCLLHESANRSTVEAGLPTATAVTGQRGEGRREEGRGRGKGRMGEDGGLYDYGSFV